MRFAATLSAGAARSSAERLDSSQSSRSRPGPDFEGETILTAVLDLGEIARGKFDFDVVGHYSRPDVFQLNVNESPMRPLLGRDRTGAKLPSRPLPRMPRPPAQ
jgi:hypothetical protein